MAEWPLSCSETFGESLNPIFPTRADRLGRAQGLSAVTETFQTAMGTGVIVVE